MSEFSSGFVFGVGAGFGAVCTLYACSIVFVALMSLMHRD